MRCIYPQEQIQDGVKALVRSVKGTAKAPLWVHVVMDGAFMFAADFLRQYPGSIDNVTFLPVSRGYSAGKVHEPRLRRGTQYYFNMWDHRKTHVILDVCVEQGKTLHYVKKLFKEQTTLPIQMVTCVLVAITDVGLPEVDHHYFSCTDAMFLTGYGMGPRRDLPEIYGIRR